MTLSQNIAVGNTSEIDYKALIKKRQKKAWPTL